MKLIQLLHQRRALAESFTKPYRSQVKQDLKSYKSLERDLTDDINIDLTEGFQRRYYFPIPLIFTNHEAFLASMFDRVPDLIFKPRGKDDGDKKRKIEAAYEYLKDKLDLESFMTDAAWWFALTGFVSAHIGYEQKAVEKPVIGEDGQPMFDEMGQPMTFIDYEEDDPFVTVGDPEKDSFSPESKFSISGKFVPYYVTEELMEPDEVDRIYGKKVDADAIIEHAEELEKKGNETKKDTDRVRVWRYYGTLPKMVRGELQGWEHDKQFGIIFTQKEVLFKDQLPLNDKQCRLLKLHGVPTEFFGFGLGKLLRPFQKEKSIRRGQMVRYADVAAYPKLLLPTATTIDKKTQRDPRENLILTFTGDQKPEYLAPPNLSQVVNDSNQLADQDAQQASGMMDISQGAQNASTVDTATGQTIFADAAEKRIRKAKRNFTKFYREVVILLLKMCQLNWSSEKLISITDERGETEQVSVSKEDLQDINFDTDIDIDAESLTVNKDILREQAIVLYDKVKEDPLVERKEVFRDLIKDGFGKQDPDRYIKESLVEPGTTLVNPQTGEQFVIDESGELVTQDAMMQTRESTTQGAGNVPSSASAQMGAV